jgi:two-component system, response regulator YesN
MYRILIADDEELERKALKHIIQKNIPSLEVVGEASNGDEALELAHEHSPDIILMDIKMPGKTGLEAAQEIMRLNPKTNIIINTAFDFFDYAQKALHIGTCEYLLKPVRPNDLLAVIHKCIKDIEINNQAVEEHKKIKEQLDQIRPHMEESFICNLVNGYIVGKNEVKKRADVLGINLLPANAMVVGIENVVNAQTFPEFQLIRQKVFDILKNIFKDNSSTLIAPIPGNKFVVLIPYNGGYAPEIQYDFCRKGGECIIRELADMNISTSIGIGKYYNDVIMIRESYLEALKAQQCSSFAGGSTIVACVDCQKSNCIASIRAHQNQKESELIELICSGDWERLREVLDILWNNIRFSNLGEDLQKACALELLVVLHRSITRSGKIRQMTVLKISNAQKLMASKTIEELGNCLYGAVQEIMENVQTKKEESLGSTITTVKSFIDNNFSKDITLENTARYFHLSPPYLSRVFSKEVGVPFKKYLTNIKLNHARLLLLSTNMSINEIALEAGYRDISYFCRMFKKNVGMSPNEYRKIKF